MSSLKHLGSYVLLLLLHQDCALSVGRLGRFDVQAGCYAYVGSALGSGGLMGRLHHHLQSINKPHWHVDYLHGPAVIHSIWFAPGKTRREHDWALLLQQLPGAALAIPRFGATDCHCPAHLYRYQTMPALRAFQQLVRVHFPEDKPIQAISASGLQTQILRKSPQGQKGDKV